MEDYLASRQTIYPHLPRQIQGKVRMMRLTQISIDKLRFVVIPFVNTVR